jgi:acyl-CoA reductase-like NAD-dependent aldehyde dehydrogenase
VTRQAPTVIDNVIPTMDVYREEIFGPVLSVVQMDDVDEAIRLVNSNPFGNSTDLHPTPLKPRAGSSVVSTSA